MSIFASDETQAVVEVINQVESDPTQYWGRQLMPALNMPTSKIYVDVWESRGGLTNERGANSDPQAIGRPQWHTQSFQPGAYEEFVRFKEQDLLFLRELGQNDQSRRGIQSMLNRTAKVLNNRIEARMELLRWQAILNGTYTYDGKVVDFAKPAQLDVAPTIPWILELSPGVFTANPAATPIEDMRFWINGGYDPFRKYTIKEVWMGPHTQRCVLDNPQVQSLIQNRFAADTYKNHDVGELLTFLVPGMPPIKTYKGSYLPESRNAVTGQIATGDAIYFLPAGRIFFVVEYPDDPTVGDVAMTLHLRSGTVAQPGVGKFLVVDEKIETNRSNPYIDLLGGFNGGPRLKRGFDCLTATVI